jgi:hypothetical protein
MSKKERTAGSGKTYGKKLSQTSVLQANFASGGNYNRFSLAWMGAASGFFAWR